MTIRPYQPADQEMLLRLFTKNTPAAFGINEIGDYADFLKTNTDPYFVAEQDNRVVGACGHYIRPDGTTARIVWIFTDPDIKGMGVGSTLLTYNLDKIYQQPAIQAIECQTSQVAYRFFERFGFVVQRTEPDYWAPGLDLYFMTATR